MYLPIGFVVPEAIGPAKGLLKIVTTAPQIGCPVFSSVTLPLIVACPSPKAAPTLKK